MKLVIEMRVLVEVEGNKIPEFREQIPEIGRYLKKEIEVRGYQPIGGTAEFRRAYQHEMMDLPRKIHLPFSLLGEGVEPRLIDREKDKIDKLKHHYAQYEVGLCEYVLRKKYVSDDLARVTCKICLKRLNALLLLTYAGTLEEVTAAYTPDWRYEGVDLSNEQ